MGAQYTFDDDGKCRVGGTGMSVRDMARRFPTYRVLHQTESTEQKTLLLWLG